MKIAVTGSTGQLGRRVAHQLADRGVEQRLVVRDPARAPGLPGSHLATGHYGDSSAAQTALADDGRVSVVAQEDIADVAVAILTSDSVYESRQASWLGSAMTFRR